MSIFNDDVLPTEGEADVTLFDSIVGDGKKFKDAEALAKGKILSDSHIQRLEEENASLRSKLDEIERLKEIMTNERQPIAGQIPVNADAPSAPNSAIDPEALVDQIAKRLDDIAFQKKAAATVAALQKDLEGLLGENWKQIVNDRSIASGIDTETLKRLAQTSPEAFKKALDISAPTKVTTPVDDVFNIGSRVNTTSISNEVSGIRDQKFYQKLKKDNPDMYWDPKVQIQMHNDAIKHGARFFE